MTYREPPAPSPIVAAFGSNVVAFDRVTGERVWTVRELAFGGAIRIDFVEEHVVVAISETLASIALKDGRIAWQSTLPFRADTVLADRDRIVVAGGGRVACYDLAGQLLWKDELKGFGLGSVALGVPGRVVNADHIG